MHTDKVYRLHSLFLLSKLMAKMTAAFSMLCLENFCIARITETSIVTLPSPYQKNHQEFINLYKFAI